MYLDLPHYCYRGGGELGKKWAEDGRQLKKQNTFEVSLAKFYGVVRSFYMHPIVAFSYLFDINFSDPAEER